MIEQERKVEKLPKIVRSKDLRLIVPELARELEIPAEAPVFVSPYVSETVRCGCGVEYRPLVYQVGREIKAHHFHRRLYVSGGIYYDKSPLKEYAKLTTMYGFVAILEPVGRKYESNDDGESEAVLVKGIRVFCEGHRTSGFGEGRFVEELEEGIVASTSYIPDLLFPLCDRFIEEHPSYLQRLKIRYNFKTIDGEVLFSQIDENKEEEEAGAI